jgi:FAD/FMN-containing dehydrogenase
MDLLTQRNGGAVKAALIHAFESDFHGQVMRPGDAGYDAARKIWNASIDKHPGLIARCSGTADVVHAVKFARPNDLLVAVRSGGHNVGGRALCDDGIVIDLSAMNGVFVDPVLRTARVQAGALLGDVDRETHLHGLAVPIGTVSKTGVGGLTLGGGMGWLARKYGLTCDNLISCEVVTAQGEVITADAITNADLLWGLRGGGGNFGIVTSFLFKAHPVSVVLGGFVIYPRDQAHAVLRHYREFMKSAPDELTAVAGLIWSQPEGVPVTAVLICYCGDIAEGERVAAPLRAFGSPMLDAVQPLPMPVMQKLIDGAFPDGTRNYWRSTFVREIGDDVLDVIIAQASRAASTLSGIVLENFGGTISRIDQDATAFAQRHGRYNIHISAQWKDAADDKPNTDWVRGVSDALRPHASGGYFLNHLGDEKPDAVRAAFGSNYARLVELKTKYDPMNFFRMNQNIEPCLADRSR